MYMNVSSVLKDVINEIVEKCPDFICFLQEYDYDVISKLPYSIDSSFGVINFSWGCEKLVVICDDLDYVFKFDIYNNEKVSSCERELRNYKFVLATEDDTLISMFAPCYKVDCEYRENVIYSIRCYPRSNELDSLADRHLERHGIEMPNYFGTKYTNEENARLEDIYNEFLSNSNSLPDDDDDLTGSFMFMEYYSEEAFDELVDFCYVHNINDIHTGNIMELDGRPVITDYSGF